MLLTSGSIQSICDVSSNAIPPPHATDFLGTGADAVGRCVFRVELQHRRHAIVIAQPRKRLKPIY